MTTPLLTAAPELRVQPGAARPDSELPMVSIVVLNLNGRHYLKACFDSLHSLRYPQDRLEIILIDNASDDGSVDEVKAAWPNVRIAVNTRNEGFARGCNQGAGLSRQGRILAFVNNDVRVHEDWLRELVQPILRRECVATTSKMLSWDGAKIDSAGGGMNFHGMGLQYGWSEPAGPEYDVPRRTLFACGGAMAIAADVFAESGGFDEEFFAYYEDVDLGWRLWVLGHEVHYVPSSVCWHHHHGTSDRFPLRAVRLIQVRNPLYACFKNYDDDHLRKVLPVALALLMRRAAGVSDIEGDTSFRIEHVRPGDRSQVPTLLDRAIARLFRRGNSLYGESTIGTLAAADLLAANDLLSRWPHWISKRREIQARRRRPDRDIFHLFLRPLWCIQDDPAFRGLFDGATEFFGVQKLFEGVPGIPERPGG